MLVEFYENGTADNLIMRAPFSEHLPNEGDYMELPADDGTVIVTVMRRTWVFTRTPDGGATAMMKCIVAPMATRPHPAAPVPPTVDEASPQ